MDKLIELLGLPKDSPQEKVYAALAVRIAEGDAAKVSFDQLSSEAVKLGFKVEGTKLSRVEPLRLDLVAKPEDDDEKKALKAALLEAENKTVAAGLSSNKEYVKKLAADLKLPPAEMAIVEECLSVRGEMEALMLSKDGKVEVRKTQELPKKLRSLFDRLVGMKGVKFSTGSEIPSSDEEKAKAEREKAAKSMLSAVQPEAVEAGK